MRLDDESGRLPFEWLPHLLQTNDSLFPSGAYAHSLGLEGMVELGLVGSRDELERFLHATIIPALQHVDLPLACHAHSAAQTRDTDRISRLDELSYVLKGSRELREAAVRLGTQRLRMLRQIDSDPIWKVIEREIESGRMRGTIPVIFGAQIAVGAMPVEAGLTAFYYQAIAGVVSAAMKLFPLGQVAAQTLVTGALGRCGSVVREAASIGEEDIGWFQPLLEIASARHETAYSRIFIS